MTNSAAPGSERSSALSSWVFYVCFQQYKSLSLDPPVREHEQQFQRKPLPPSRAMSGHHHTHSFSVQKPRGGRRGRPPGKGLRWAAETKPNPAHDPASVPIPIGGEPLEPAQSSRRADPSSVRRPIVPDGKLVICSPSLTTNDRLSFQLKRVDWAQAED
jgi:hypothetical protein